MKHNLHETSIGSVSRVKQKKKFSSPIGHSGAHCCKLRTTFGFSRRDNCNKIYKGIAEMATSWKPNSLPTKSGQAER
jgi:hypothetical protein